MAQNVTQNRPAAVRAAAALAGATLLASLAPALPAGALAADSGASDPGRLATVPKSLVIGVDGATFATLAGAGLTAIPRLQAQGTTATSNLYAEPMAPTLSGPGWASIATGVWPDKHRVHDNAFTGNQFATYPDYLTRIERTASAKNTLVVGTWDPITTTVFGSGVQSRVDGADDEDTTAKAVSALRTGNPDAAFVHLDEVDEAGHAHGTTSTEYRDALREADAHVGRLVAAVESRSTYAGESWQIIVTADHGHTAAGGHGGNSPAERQTFVIARGSGIAAGSTRNDVKLVDIAPTVLTHLGLATPSGVDGRALSAITPDAFDSLRPSLKSAVDESVTGKGWTTTAPSGWTIDNSRMPTGGTTEWRGWSFTTDEFWTNAALGQGRETNVRARNVFAVADSDEWDDTSHSSGQFDSTLTSPAYTVSGRSSVNLRFATTYAVDGPQTAKVLVSFDGSAPITVKNYSAATNTVESIPVTVPSGAKSVKVSFAYTGTNSLFWTVDQVSVS